MKQESTTARRAAWLFLAAPAFLAVPAQAQDAPTPQEATPPPPVVRTVPQADTPSTTTSIRGTDPASRTTIAPGAADVVDDARIASRPERRVTPTREPRRTVTAARTAAPAAAAATTAAAPTETAPAAETPSAPVAQPAAPAAPAAQAPAAATSEAATTRQATSDTGAPLWPLAAIAAVIIGIGAFFLMRRRNREDEAVYYEEPVYAEPAAVAEPVAVTERAPVAAPAVVAAAPLAAAPMAAAAASHHTRAEEPVAAGLADEATVTDAPAEDVAALTGGAPAVKDRPWLELAMRPVRAGTSAEEALVEIELTIANSGGVAAEDVRVSTFMLTDAHASEMENMLVDTPADAAIDPVMIAPGEGTRIDATLAALKSDLGTEGRFTPVVVADARYRLPDGSEGRTSASFVVGVSDDEGGTLIPIDLADRVMREDVEARLHGEPEHA